MDVPPSGSRLLEDLHQQDRLSRGPCDGYAEACVMHGSQAILAMDARKLGKALSDTMRAWSVMLPYTTDPYLGKDGVYRGSN